MSRKLTEETFLSIGNKTEYLKKLVEDKALLDYECLYKARYAKIMWDEVKEMPGDDKIGAARKAFMLWTEMEKEARRQYAAGRF